MWFLTWNRRTAQLILSTQNYRRKDSNCSKPLICGDIYDLAITTAKGIYDDYRHIEEKHLALITQRMVGNTNYNILRKI